MRKTIIFSLALLFTLPILGLNVSLRSFDHDGYTRLVLECNEEISYSFRNGGNKLELELNFSGPLDLNDQQAYRSSLISRITRENKGDSTQLSVLFQRNVDLKRSFELRQPFRVVFDLLPGSNSAASGRLFQPDKKLEAQVVEETNDSGRQADEPQPRQVAGAPGLSDPLRQTIDTICIDPGHGGEDFGAVGKAGLLEKDVTLKVANKLRSIIESRLGLRVVMTREKDSDVSLNARAAIANNQRAQLFVSIHVNSSFRASARGSETYFVSLKATDQEAIDLARKENSAHIDLDEELEDDDLQMILWNMAQTEYIRQSSMLAEQIQQELNDLLDTRNRGVKQAPFRVLMRVAMPAVLVEVAFISNESEERKLMNEAFLENVALAIYRGITRFIAYHNSSLQ